MVSYRNRESSKSSSPVGKEAGTWPGRKAAKAARASGKGKEASHGLAPPDGRIGDIRFEHRAQVGVPIVVGRLDEEREGRKTFGKLDVGSA